MDIHLSVTDNCCANVLNRKSTEQVVVYNWLCVCNGNTKSSSEGAPIP